MKPENPADFKQLDRFTEGIEGDKMKYASSCLASFVIAVCALGCSSSVETTEDSTKLEVEVPKIEVGEAPLDLDPSTDDDVDIDTPAPGDQ